MYDKLDDMICKLDNQIFNRHVYIIPSNKELNNLHFLCLRIQLCLFIAC